MAWIRKARPSIDQSLPSCGGRGETDWRLTLFAPISIALALAFAPVSAVADFAAGVAAYDGGDLELAISEWRAAAEEGDTRAQTALGNAYASGLFVATDHRKATRWYLKAAQNGNAEAQYSLAANYAAGLGIGKNLPEAIRWLQTAAENGEIRAQYELAERYAAGRDVPQDPGLATHWYLAAAEQGHVVAQMTLAQRYDQGRGAVRNAVDAYVWYFVASRRDSTFARRLAEPLDRLENLLAPADLTRARVRAQAWLDRQL